MQAYVFLTNHAHCKVLLHLCNFYCDCGWKSNSSAVFVRKRLFYQLLIMDSFLLPRGTEIKPSTLGQMLSCFLTELCWDSVACMPKQPVTEMLRGERAVVGYRKFLFKPRQQLKAFPPKKLQQAFTLQRVFRVSYEFSGKFI